MRHTLLEPSIEDIHLYPSLARALGSVNLAIVVSAFDRNIQKSVDHDGFRWSCISLENLQHFFPFWSLNTIHKAIADAEKEGFLVSRRNPETSWFDVTKMYRVNYDKVNKLLGNQRD